MPRAIPIIFAVLGFVAVLAVLVILGLSKMVRGIAAGETRLDPLDGDDLASLLEEAEELIARAEQLGYTIEEAFRITIPGGAATQAVFMTRPDRCDHLAVMRTPRGAVRPGFSSIRRVRGAAGSTMIDTHAVPDELVLPKPPDMFVQVFDSADLDELHERHQDAIRHVGAQVPLDTEPIHAELGPLVRHAVALDATYVTRRPLWVLRLPWWMIVRRATLVNKPIAERYPAGHPRYANLPAVARVFA